MKSPTLKYAVALLTALGGTPARALESNMPEILSKLKNESVFFYQCTSATQPALKAMEFMFVGHTTMFGWLVQDNNYISTFTYIDFEEKTGEWKLGGEQPLGQGERLSRNIYESTFKLLTAEQFKVAITSTPTETCK